MASSSSEQQLKSKKQVPAQAETEFVRLHIAPLTPETTASLIPESVLDEAARKSLSYHTIQTFPENSYAFINLPKAQAGKLKKRLNGSVFRGVKVRVEEARPETWVKHPEAEENMDAESAKKTRKEERKEKRKRSKAEGEPKIKKRKKGEDGILEGVGLPEGRKVQRGWTKPAVPTGVPAKYAGKSSSSAKRTEDGPKRECLFKTPLPPNKATPKDEKKKGKEGKKEEKDKKKRKREVVIKEFKNNTKFPQFLRVSQLDKNQANEKMASEYVEGVGWVNAKGDVVEEDKVKKRFSKVAQTEVEVPESADALKDVDVTDVVGASESDDDDEVMADAANTVSTEAKAESEDDSSAESEAEAEAEKPSDSSSSDSSSSESDGEETTEKKSPITPLTPVSPTKPTRTASTTSPKAATPALQITIPTTTNPPVQAIHPLEALYKPTANPPTTILQVNTNTAPSPASAAESSTFKFSFAADESDDEEPVPQVPFRDRYRSAAPTPDTAIGHRKFFPDDDDGTAHGGRLGFVPSTPRVVGGFPGGNELLTARRDSTPYTPSTDSPLLFAHSESRFLGALSVWSKLPAPKILPQTEEEPAEGEEEAEVQGKKGKKKRKANAMEESEETPTGEKSVAEIWTEKFHENRGEWNRAWKNRRRDAVKQSKKKEPAGNPGSKRIAA